MRQFKLFLVIVISFIALSFIACIGHDESAWGEVGSSNGHEWVDLGLGVKWATCNIGANNPWEAGEYFAWGDTVSKVEYVKGNCSAWGKELNDISGNAEYDVARCKWGDGWRMPTYEEMKELKINCEWTCTTVNGVVGYRVKAFNGNSIFLPFVGYYNGSALYDYNDHGCYWGSESYGIHRAYSFLLTGDSYNYLANSILFGCSVRPVLE